MVKAIFKKKYFWNVLCLLCGLIIIGLFIFLGHKDREVTMGGMLSGITVGTVICALSIVCLLFNCKAYLYIEDGHIIGKYHWFGKIDCNFCDVEFALPQINTLTIQLKNGKRHVIMGMENAFVLCSVIRRNMNFDAAEQPDILIRKLNNQKSAKKKGLIFVCSGVALMFINIFVTVFLTGGRELYEFSKTDWLIMAFMGVVEIATIVATFYFAQKAGKNNLPIEQTKYTIQRTMIETGPLLPGNVIKVYADDDYSGRITLFGYPNEASVYYSVQTLHADYVLENVYTSEIYEDMEHIPYQLESLIDITDKVLH